MSRPPEAADLRWDVPGHTALPLPRGEAGDLRAAAHVLARTADVATRTAAARGALAPLLAQVWAGRAATAATAAIDEAAELGRRSRHLLEGVADASRELARYASALGTAFDRVRRLQSEWDSIEADHTRAVALVATAGVPAPGELERLRKDRDVGRARLSRAHEAVLHDLRATRLRAAGRIAVVTERLVPGAHRPPADDVRLALTGGLPLADGLARARSARSLGLRDAAYVRGMVGSTKGAAPSGSVSCRGGEEATRQLVDRLRAHAHDPVYAQTLLDEIGVDGVGALVTRLGSSDEDVTVDTMRALLGALGSVVVTAARGSRGMDVDEGTRALTSTGAALFANSLVRGMRTVHTDSTGRSRNAGYWIIGQLLVGARSSGDGRSLPPALVAGLAASASAAEVAEIRDSDAGLRHGSTMRPSGVEYFASWFDRGSETGDALHVLLGEVGDHPSDVAELLTTPLADSETAGAALANSRGERMTVAEHLTRRWITYEANGVEAHADLRLTTDDDLLRLTRLAGGSGPAPLIVAGLRARIVGEVGRASAWSRLEPTATQIYERTTRAVEDESLTWAADLRHAMSAVIRGDDVAPATYARLLDGGAVPELTRVELVALVGAYTTGHDVSAPAKDPAANLAQLIELELALLADPSRSIAEHEEAVRRLGFLDTAAASTLMAQAELQDARSQQMWQSIAEAKNAVLVGRTFATTAATSGLKAATEVLGDPAQSLLESGTTRDAVDNMAIELVRSDIELDQALRNERRRAELLAQVAAMLGGRGGQFDPAEAFVRGAAAAPRARTSAEVRAARSSELVAKASVLLDARVEQRLFERIEGLTDQRADQRADQPSPGSRPALPTPVDPAPRAAR